MDVRVTVKAPQSMDGLESILEQWRTQFPRGEVDSISSYGGFSLTLKMPPATTVQVPQLIDARAESVE